MASSMAIPQARAEQPARLLRAIPGVLLLAAVGNKGFGPYAVGATGEVVMAIFTLGLVAGAGKLFGR